MPKANTMKKNTNHTSFVAWEIIWNLSFNGVEEAKPTILAFLEQRCIEVNSHSNIMDFNIDAASNFAHLRRSSMLSATKWYELIHSELLELQFSSDMEL
ncbi:hypothetical protein HanPI659440_Chr16g0640311 [Helianthus annuus]|nr:hypothetical protein HanPI659440_Chr16g0640311 [Helianthus annuus]